MSELFTGGLVLSLPYLAILVILAILTPSWRWVAGFVLVSGSVLGGLWIWLVTIGPTVSGAGYFAGRLMASVLTLAYAIGVLGYLALRICYRTRA